MILRSRQKLIQIAVYFASNSQAACGPSCH